MFNFCSEMLLIHAVDINWLCSQTGINITNLLHFIQFLFTLLFFIILDSYYSNYSLIQGTAVASIKSFSYMFHSLS